MRSLGNLLFWSFVIFLILKLTDVINWSWFAVFMPLTVFLSLAIGAGAEAAEHQKKEEK